MEEVKAFFKKKEVKIWCGVFVLIISLITGLAMNEIWKFKILKINHNYVSLLLKLDRRSY